MTYSDVRKNEEINTYIRQADAALSAVITAADEIIHCRQ